MVTKTDIITLHRLKPLLSADQLAAQLGCSVEQVFQSKQRYGLKIPRKTGRAHSRPNNVFALGREARKAGLTVEMIRQMVS